LRYDDGSHQCLVPLAALHRALAAVVIARVECVNLIVIQTAEGRVIREFVSLEESRYAGARREVLLGLQL